MSILSKSNKLLIAALCMLSPFIANATVVEIRTSLGTIEVNLFDNVTPKTVDNFLSYIDSGAYANNVVHRSVSDFVVQAGGFTFNGDFPLVRVGTDPAIENEPKLSNVRGTIAMAKGGDPDSATSQWFINTANNASSLDVADNAGGFTVFGQVLGDGMDIVEQINALNSITFNGLANFPIRNEIAGQPLIGDNLVLIEDIVVTDRAADTNPSIVPVRNTRLNQPTMSGNSDSSGGGSIFWLALMALCGIQVRRYVRFK